MKAFVVFPFINQVRFNSHPVNHLSTLRRWSQMILEYGITHGDEKKLGYYAGNMVSALFKRVKSQALLITCQNTLFFLTEMIFVLYWGRTSDR